MDGEDVLGRWLVESVGGQPVISDPSVELGADGRITGRTGLNRMMGSFEVVDGVLRCSPLATTRMAGPPELMDQENRLLAALAEPAPIELDDARLVLGAGDHELTLVRATEGSPAGATSPQAPGGR